MPSYVVSGAGSTAYNGTYDENGTANGYPKYTLQGGGAEIYKQSDMPPPMGVFTWRIYTSAQTGYTAPAGAAYYKTGTITGTYTKGNNGNNPTPTVAEASSTSISNMNGLAKGSISNVNGLAIASVANINGLA